MCLAQTVHNGGGEGGKVRVIAGIQTSLLDKLPQALDQVQVGRISREKTEFDL
jgi:hypothetical protein